MAARVGPTMRCCSWVVAFAVALLAAACSQRPPPPILGNAPELDLADRSGRSISLSDLDGQPWVADFIFTRCPAICPLMTTAMSTIDDLAARDIRLVSITLDPEHDTAEILDAFADRHGASPRWLFLRGGEEQAHALSREFALGSSAATATAPIVHSTRLVLVDSHHRIRGYYDALDEGEMARLLAELGTILEGG